MLIAVPESVMCIQRGSYFSRFLFKGFILKYVYFIYVRVCAHDWRCLWRLEESNLLELELQAVGNCQMIWVLGTRLGSSARAASALHHGGVSMAPFLILA